MFMAEIKMLMLHSSVKKICSSVTQESRCSPGALRQIKEGRRVQKSLCDLGDLLRLKASYMTR